MSFWEMFLAEGKNEGLEAVEESTKLVCKALFRALSKSALASENTYVKMAVPILAMIEPPVMDLIDQINPADNEPT